MNAYEDPYASDHFMEALEPMNSYNAVKDFTSFQAWQKAREVKLFFYKKILAQLPKEEKYCLDTQIRRATLSTTANIAEGYGRFHYQEGIQFYRISRACLYELKDHLISSLDLNYIKQKCVAECHNLIEKVKITLNGNINYTKNKK